MSPLITLGLVDCGGPCMTKCALGKGCSVAADCVTVSCASGVCAAPTCSDMNKNGQETDVDCGGPTCSRCGDGKGCAGAADCTSGVCANNQCAAPTCSDMVKNGMETDIDCGGNCQTGCGTGKGCAAPSDCASGVCTGNACAAATCTDMVKNGSESDIDCGGSCPPCNIGAKCAISSDCKNAVCESTTCTQARTCKALKAAQPMLPSGAYVLDPDGNGMGAPLTAWCDMTTDGGGWTLVARVNGTDAHNLLFASWTTNTTLGNGMDFGLTAGGDVLYPAYNAVPGDELLFYDATANCGSDKRLLQSKAFLGNRSLRQFLVATPNAPVEYLNCAPTSCTTAKPNFQVPAFRNTGCVHPFNPDRGGLFPNNVFGINLTYSTYVQRFAIQTIDWDTGIGSQSTPDTGYNSGDMDPLGDGHTGWPGHIVTLYVR